MHYEHVEGPGLYRPYGYFGYDDYHFHDTPKSSQSSLYVECWMCGDIFWEEDIGMWYNKHTDTQAYKNELCPYCYLDYINNQEPEELKE